MKSFWAFAFADSCEGKNLRDTAEKLIKIKESGTSPSLDDMSDAIEKFGKWAETLRPGATDEIEELIVKGMQLWWDQLTNSTLEIPVGKFLALCQAASGIMRLKTNKDLLCELKNKIGEIAAAEGKKKMQKALDDSLPDVLEHILKNVNGDGDGQLQIGDNDPKLVDFLHLCKSSAGLFYSSQESGVLITNNYTHALFFQCVNVSGWPASQKDRALVVIVFIFVVCVVKWDHHQCLVQDGNTKYIEMLLQLEEIAWKNHLAVLANSCLYAVDRIPDQLLRNEHLVRCALIKNHVDLSKHLIDLRKCGASIAEMAQSPNFKKVETLVLTTVARQIKYCHKRVDEKVEMHEEQHKKMDALVKEAQDSILNVFNYFAKFQEKSLADAMVKLKAVALGLPDGKSWKDGIQDRFFLVSTAPLVSQNFSSTKNPQAIPLISGLLVFPFDQCVTILRLVLWYVSFGFALS